MASAGDGDLRHKPHHADLLESGYLVGRQSIFKSAEYPGCAANFRQIEPVLSRCAALSRYLPEFRRRIIISNWPKWWAFRPHPNRPKLLGASVCGRSAEKCSGRRKGAYRGMKLERNAAVEPQTEAAADAVI